MADDETPAGLLRLRACARELEEAIARSNAPLPDDMSVERLTTLTKGLRELDEAESEDSRGMLVYARHVLREARDVLRSVAVDDDSPHYSVERALNDASIEVGDLLELVPQAQLLTLQPPLGSSSLIIRRDDAAIVGKLDALVERVAGLERQTTQAARQVGPVIIAEKVSHYELNLIKELKVNLDSLIKNTISLNAELRARLVDLDWLTQLTKRVGELAESLKGGVDALGRVGTELERMLAEVRWVSRLAERVVLGGTALMRFIKRALRRPPPLTPGTVFRDVDEPWCPELVVIPPGHFLMGSPEDEEGRSDDEGPQHEVRFARGFTLGRYAVTFDEYDAFCEATGREKPHDAGWGRGRRPVINVSWFDAQDYCVWLAERTSRSYRLPNEAEWEYACRAGTTRPFSFGSTISTEKANYNGILAYSAKREGRYRERTVPVDGFGPNGFGLRQMHGNVREWVEDYCHDTYDGAPSDGSAWLAGGGPRRILRGGSWSMGPTNLRAASRARILPAIRCNDAGFRVARALTS